MNDFTLKQLLIAAGLSKGITRTEICRVAECGNSYISKNLNNPEFRKLKQRFSELPEDKDTKEYKGVGTLFMEVGRFLYFEGENFGKK